MTEMCSEGGLGLGAWMGGRAVVVQWAETAVGVWYSRRLPVALGKGNASRCVYSFTHSDTE